MTIHISALMLKWAGLPLFLLTIICLLGGSLPDNSGSRMLDTWRWVVWPAFVLWLGWIIVRGLAL